MMKLLTICLSAALLSSCGGNSQPSSPAAPQASPKPAVTKIAISRDSVLRVNEAQDTSQSYEIYYPKSCPAPEAALLLVCFDPHGDGRLPVDKYRKWADKYGIAVAGSNTSHNGQSMEDGQQIARNMIADLNDHLGFDYKNMTLCGFSGGAKVAINAISMNTDIPNLIYAGAVTQLSATQALNILGFAGQQDMNYSDLLSFDQSMEVAHPNATLIEWTGKHEWPDAAIFEQAFYWMDFQAWRSGPSQRNAATIQAFEKNMNASIAAATKSNNWLQAYQLNRTAYTFLNGIADVSAYKAQLQSITANDLYKKALAQKSETLQKEDGQKQMLMQAFQNQNGDWWTKVVNQYKASKDPSDKRLLGFISLACYSYSNQLLQQHNLDGAERILAIYELADPANTDQLYFHAVLYADKNDIAKAMGYLKKAVSNGFKDGAKIEAEPAFTPLRNDPGFVPLLASLKNAPK